MIFADIQGKLGKGAEKATPRSEDLLTSTVFGLLRYLPTVDGLIALLDRARSVTLDALEQLVIHQPGLSWLPAGSVAHFEIEFWPHLGVHGEVDTILRLFSREGILTHIVLVEAKYTSPKSRSADSDDQVDDDDAATDPDQLVDYWRGAKDLDASSTATLALVYLTAHAMPPRGELEESLRRCPTMRIAWLSWRDAHFVARTVDRATGALPARDLARYLAHKGLKYFDGFAARSLGELPPPIRRYLRPMTGYRNRTSFPLEVSSWTVSNGHFWRG